MNRTYTRTLSPDTYTDAEITARQADLPREPLTPIKAPENQTAPPTPNTPPLPAPLTPSELDIGQSQGSIVENNDSNSISDKNILDFTINTSTTQLFARNLDNSQLAQ